MCGIVAMFSKQVNGFFTNDKAIFSQMLIANVFRGFDSTGVFGVKKNGNLDLIKEASASPYFMGRKDTIEFFNDIVSDYHIVVGHNRKATMGTVTDETAHPYVEGDICLVHNGTLTNHRNLAQTTIDSHAICHNINEKGYKPMLKNIDGAYALIWYNAAEKKVYFCRNSERPLFLVETNDKIFIASEGKMLDWILDRNNIAKFQIQNVPTDKVFKFDLETKKLECESKPKKDPVSQKASQTIVTHYHQKNSHSQHSGTQSQQHGVSNDASIHDYRSGDEVTFELTDLDIKPAATCLMGKTADVYEAQALVWIQHNDYTPEEYDALVSAKYITAKITSVIYKPATGVTVWAKKPIIDDMYESINGIPINKSVLEHYGSCCYTCGNALLSAEDVSKAEITVNSRNEIVTITCEFCLENVSPLFQGIATC